MRTYDEPTEIAVFAGDRVLMRAKRMMAGGDSSVTVTVKEKPSEVGVDPYHILIDRMPGDNRKAVSLN